jgi:dTDP-glucose 4,6-dehydratase
MSAYQPKKILVTGGAGFIGSNFIAYLLREYPDVFIVNLDKLTYAGTLDNLQALPDPTRHHFVQGDIADALLVKNIFAQHAIDTVVHFAAESHVDRSITGPDAFVQTNVVGTFTLLEAARQYWLQEQGWSGKDCRFHHVSTDEVYGSLGPQDEPFAETTPYAPNSPYSASKAASDHLVRAYSHTYGLPITMSNCSNNYGPNQHGEKLLPTIIRACLQQKAIPIYGDGSNRRDWLYVEDHCHAVDLIIRRGELGRAYNIGANNEWSNLEMAKYIAACMDKQFAHGAPHERLIESVGDRPGHDWRYAINFTRINTELGWQPQWSFKEAVLKTIASTLEQPV